MDFRLADMLAQYFPPEGGELGGYGPPMNNPFGFAGGGGGSSDKPGPQPALPESPDGRAALAASVGMPVVARDGDDELDPYQAAKLALHLGRPVFSGRSLDPGEDLPPKR